jgi:transposase
VDVKLPQLKEKVEEENGVLIHEDEASFGISGTTSRTWMEKGKDGLREVMSKAARESIKVFGAVTVEENPRFHFRIAEVFNAVTFLGFLKQLVRQYDRKIFLILDNARYHHALLLQEWLEANKSKIELHFLPAYSPQFNAQECVWRLTRRKSTHNRYFSKKSELHKTIFRRFNRFQGNPASLRGIIEPFKKEKKIDADTLAA